MDRRKGVSDGVRARQRRALLGMLGSMRPGEYKVLIVDESARSLLRAARLGAPPAWRAPQEQIHPSLLTMLLGISDRRYRLSGVPALYFIAPTAENLVRVARDLSAGLYHACELHFTSSVPLPLLAGWVDSVLKDQVPNMTLERVEKVTDRYVAFEPDQEDLFHLGIPNTYRTLYDEATPDATIEEHVSQIAQGLVSVLVTLKMIPIIRSQRGGPAETVARELNATLRDLLENRRSLFIPDKGSQRSFRRPLLLLLDRDIDLPCMVHHSWTYLSLLTNTIGLSNDCKVTIPSHNDSSTFTLEESDQFWQENKFKPFPKVAEAIESSLAQYRREFEEINASATLQETPVTTSQLAETISNLPELTRRKECLDMHTEIASAILDTIRAREIDSFFELESQLMTQVPVADKQAILAAITGPQGTCYDKMALSLVYYLLAGEITEADAGALSHALAESNCNSRLTNFLKARRPPSPDRITAPRPSLVTSGTKRAFVRSMFSDVVDKGVKGLSEAATKVKEKVVQLQDATAVSRIVKGVMEGSHSVAESLEGFDPKLWRGSESRDSQAQSFDEAVVFVVGGGNYSEYQNIKGHNPGKRIIYGSTELNTLKDFLDQLLEVSKPSMRQQRNM